MTKDIELLVREKTEIDKFHVTEENVAQLVEIAQNNHVLCFNGDDFEKTKMRLCLGILILFDSPCTKAETKQQFKNELNNFFK